MDNKLYYYNIRQDLLQCNNLALIFITIAKYK